MLFYPELAFLDKHGPRMFMPKDTTCLLTHLQKSTTNIKLHVLSSKNLDIIILWHKQVTTIIIYYIDSQN